eukprot:365527-Chlamydomonas_euryale.AAC.8
MKLQGGLGRAFPKGRRRRTCREDRRDVRHDGFSARRQRFGTVLPARSAAAGGGRRACRLRYASQEHQRWCSGRLQLVLPR